jgi:UDP:flavonoid glycosyltransferase YjiC (YdhE family)
LRGVHRVSLNAQERSFHVAMLSSDAGLSQTFVAKSVEEAKSWVVSLRVAVAAAQRRVLKRSIKLAHITGVHSPVRDIVLGDRCLTLAVAAGDSVEHVWLGRVSDFEVTLRRLSELWIAALDAGPPPDTPARDEEADALFVRTFKLPDEVLRSSHPVALVLDRKLRAKGELFLTDNLLCLHVHSLLHHMLAVVPWTSIEEIANDRFLLARGVDLTVRSAGGETRHLALSLPGDHNAVRAELRALWAARRASAKPGAAAVFDDTGAQFLNARAKQFQERFGADIPITEQVQFVFTCALWRSDERRSGELCFTPNFLAFAGADGTKLVLARSAIDSVVHVVETGVTLVKARDGAEFHFLAKGRDADEFRAALHGAALPAPVAVAASAPASFYHANLASFRRTFALPQAFLIEQHSCAYVSPKLLDVRTLGTLSIANTHLAFKATMSAMRIVVPLAEVASVTTQKHAFFARNALRVQLTDGSFFHFVGFNSLEQTLHECHLALAAARNASAAPAAPAAVEAARSAANELSDRLRGDSLRDERVPAPLRVAILTIGSRGDVQPTLALGRALQADGHTVTIGTHAEFKPFVEKAGLAHATLAGDPKALMSLCVSNGMFTPSFIREALANFGTFIDELLRSALAVVKSTDAQLIIQAPTVFAGAHIAEALRIPLINWFTMPHTPTAAFPHPFAVSQVPLATDVYNRASFEAVRHALWQPLAGRLNKFRVEIGLKPLPRSVGPTINDGVPMIYCFSRHLVPKPNEWPSTVSIAGFFFEETAAGAPAFVPPKPLADFLAAGPPPIYVGFGSITGIDDVDAFFEKVLQAVALSKQRCILLTGWANLGGGKPLPANVFVLESVPHDWLFPQCAAVVHHGGAGTLAAGLRAGMPTICVAFFADQFFWAACVSSLGAGFSFEAAKLDAQQLGAAMLDAATNPDIKRRAVAIGQKIAAEGGVNNAKRFIYATVNARQLAARVLDE